MIAALSLATDLGTGLPFEHGLHSTLVAMRLGERLGIDAETVSQTYYACLLFYVGCTADAEIVAETFGDDAAMLTHFHPVMFGSRAEVMTGIMRALATPGSPAPLRAVQVARRLPSAVRGHQRHVAALCEVAEMLTARLGLPASVQRLFVQLTERWDGRGDPGHAKGEGRWPCGSPTSLATLPSSARWAARSSPYGSSAIAREGPSIRRSRRGSPTMPRRSSSSSAIPQRGRRRSRASRTHA